MMFLASNKFCRSFICLSSFLLFSTLAFSAEMGSISVVSSGSDLPEAMKNSLHQAVNSSFSGDKGLDKTEKLIQKNILENEVMNSPSQFVSSYKIVEGGQAGYININATVETDTIRALLNFVPRNFSSNKILLLVKSNGTPSPAIDSALEKSVELALKDRLLRRKFSLISTADFQDSSTLSEDFTQPDILKMAGDKVEASLSIAFRMNYEEVENENSHGMDDRLQVAATIYDNKAAKVLARFNNSMVLPKSAKKDSMANDWSRVASDEAGSFFQGLLIKAGEHFLNAGEQKDGIILRIVDAPNFPAVNHFRLAIEGMKDVKQIIESSIRKGAYDFSIRSALDKEQLEKKILALPLDEAVLKLAENTADSAMIVLEMKSKSVEPVVTPKEVNHE